MGEALDPAKEQIMMLNNGCLCCTVRDDLVDMLNTLVSEGAGGGGLCVCVCVGGGGSGVWEEAGRQAGKKAGVCISGAGGHAQHPGE